MQNENIKIKGLEHMYENENCFCYLFFIFCSKGWRCCGIIAKYNNLFRNLFLHIIITKIYGKENKEKSNDMFSYIYAYALQFAVYVIMNVITDI